MVFKKLLEAVLSGEAGLRVDIDSLKESPCSKPGQNFTSVVSLVHVEGRLLGGGLYSKVVFVKRSTMPADHDFAARAADGFSNEVLMYRTVLPLVTEAADVTSPPWPRVYHASSDVIVLENLLGQGFGLGDADQGFDLEVARSIVEKLAQFHAASYHTSVVQRASFERVTSELRAFGLAVSANRERLETSLRRTVMYMEDEEDLTVAATRLSKLRGKVLEKLQELRKPSRISVLVHGDFWFNNILFRRGFEDPEDNIRLVDFQACAILSPAVDFWLFLYTSVSPRTLASGRDSLVHIYSSVFLSTLNTLNKPSDQIPAIESIQNELASKELYGFLACMAYLPALYIKWEMVDEIRRASEEEMADERFMEKFVRPELRKRLTELARNACKHILSL